MSTSENHVDLMHANFAAANSTLSTIRKTPKRRLRYNWYKLDQP